ncbi:hypothetical protein DFH27DRAFT_370428 [Peziza echinospora]|nr:hypothetical protein DFH27DRAFT_370428 [Peziza echinospora]
MVPENLENNFQNEGTLNLTNRPREILSHADTFLHTLDTSFQSTQSSRRKRRSSDILCCGPHLWFAWLSGSIGMYDDMPHDDAGDGSATRFWIDLRFCGLQGLQGCDVTTRLGKSEGATTATVRCAAGGGRWRGSSPRAPLEGGSRLLHYMPIPPNATLSLRGELGITPCCATTNSYKGCLWCRALGDGHAFFLGPISGGRAHAFGLHGVEEM